MPCLFLIISCLQFFVGTDLRFELTQAQAQSNSKSEQSSKLSEMSEKQIKANIQRLRLEIESDSQNIDHYLDLTAMFLKVKDFQTALNIAHECEGKFNLRDKDMKIFYYKALAFRNLGRYPEALRAYERYIQLKPEETEAYFGLAITYEKLGDLDQAKSYYRFYIDREKNPVRAKSVQFAQSKLQTLQGSNVIAIDRQNPEQQLMNDSISQSSESQSSASQSSASQNNTNSTIKQESNQQKSFQYTADQMEKIASADTLFDQGEYQKAQVSYQAVLNQVVARDLENPHDALKSLIEKSMICAFLLDQSEEITRLSMLLLNEQSVGLPFAIASMHYLKQKQIQKQPPIQINEIKIALKEGRFYHALDLITQVQSLQAEPKILLDYLKGKTLFSIGKYEEAVQLFQKSYQQMPHPYLMMELINAAMANRQNQLAQQYVEDYLAKTQSQNTQNPSRFYLQARQYLDQLKVVQ